MVKTPQLDKPGLWRVGQEELDYVARAIESGLKGKYVTEFEEKFCEVFEAEYAISVNSGTSALHVALAALDIGPGDEVIVPPLTFAASVFCAFYVGAKPVFADVDPDTFLIDPISIEEKITSKTRGIVTVSLFGLMPDMNAIKRIADKHGLFIIEDNAQCVLGQRDGNKLGQVGDVSIYSLQRSKHLTTGDGGVVTTNSEKLAEKIRKFADLGYRKLTAKPITNENFKNTIQHPDYKRHAFVGFNFRLPEVVAAMGIAQLEKAKGLIDLRIQIGRCYDEVVKKCSWLVSQHIPENAIHTYWTYVVRLADDAPCSWEKFREVFLNNGGSPFYGSWSLIYLEPAMQDMVDDQGNPLYSKGLCPHAEKIQPRLIQLKTNFESLDIARDQTKALEKTIGHF